MSPSSTLMRACALLFCMGALAYAGLAPAEIYKHVDEDGHVTYSNLPTKGARKLDTGPMAEPAKGNGKGSARPANFPRVDATTQKKRDDLRRKVLLDELNAEQRSLKQAESSLAEGRKLRQGEKPGSRGYLDRLDQLQDLVSRHQKNIEAINRELASMH
jgi:Domain of unknown function (DUF4124)